MAINTPPKNQNDNVFPIKPPAGLLRRIIKRLGLEKELSIIRRHLGLFSTALAIFGALVFFAVIGLKQVLNESSFGSYLSLFFSDPDMVFKYWRESALSFFESIPAFNFLILLSAIGFLIIFARLVGVYWQKQSALIKSAKKPYRYGYK